MLLYHQAAAAPPAKAEAAAITPSLSHPEDGVDSACGWGEVSDSKKFVTCGCVPYLSYPSLHGGTLACALDAKHCRRFRVLAGNIISIFVFDFDQIYAMVYIFQ